MPDEYTLTIHRGKWALTFREGGRRLRITTGTADEQLAESRARELWARRNAAKSERVADLWPLYVKDRETDGVLADRFRVTWKALEPHFGQRIGSAITRDDCRAYHKARVKQGKAASTIVTELALLRACLRWRYKNAAPSIWLPPASPPRDRWLSKDEARQIIEAAQTPHIKLFVILALTTGARASAILDLTWDRVDFAQGTIDYRPAGRHQTNKRRVVVRFNDRARQALLKAHEGRLSDHVIEYGGKPVGSIKKGIQRLSERTGIAFTPHVLRHTCAVWMAQENVPILLISQALGHTTVRTTEAFYARYSPAYMQEASAATEF